MRRILAGLLLVAGPLRAAEVCPTDTATQPLAMPDRAILVGSSTMQWGFGPALAEAVEELGMEVVHNGAVMSTGLSRPDFFDWLAASERLADEHAPDVVFVQMGGNDAQPLRDVDRRRLADWGTPTWSALYAGRVRALIDLFQARGAQVVWIGLPRSEIARFDGRTREIDGLVRRVVRDAGALWIDLHEPTTASDGSPRSTIQVDGRWHRLHRDDGIHLGKWGAPWAARHVVSVLRRHLDLTDTCDAAPLPPTPAAP